MTALQDRSPAGAETSAAVAQRVNSRAKRDAWLRRGPLLPALIFTIVVTQLPFLVAIVFAFRRYDADRPKVSGWTLRNFEQVFTNKAILQDMWHTVQLVVVVILVSLLFGLGIALLLNRKFPGRGAVRTMMIAPFLIVPVAAALYFGMASSTHRTACSAAW